MKDRLPPAPVLALAVLVPLLSMIPTWQGYHYEHPPERVFMGFRYMAGDHYQYAAFIREAQDGTGLLMRNPFTTDPQKGAFVLPYFWLLGTASRLAGGGAVLWWNLSRLLGGALYIIAFWWFAGCYFESAGERTMATALFSLAGGLDWVVALLNAAGWAAVAPLRYPYDYFWNWSTFGTLQVPNWIWPALCLLLAARAALSRSRLRDAAIFALLPATWFLHAYSGMVAYLAFGLLPIVPVAREAFARRWPSRERLMGNARAAAPALASFVVVAGYLLWARSDPVFRANSEQGFVWKPTFAFGWYLLSYGLLLPPAWSGLRLTLRERSTASDLPIAWLAAAVLLSANPYYAGVKFQYLVFPPLAVLAARGLIVLARTKRFMKRLTASRTGVAALSCLLCMNAPVSLVKDFAAARDDKDIYMPAAAIEAMRWLGDQPDGPVLCGYRAGNRIPWLAGKSVYVGHWFMTPHLSEKSREVAIFFSGQAPISLRRAVLARSSARYVFVGPEEAAAGFSDIGLPLEKIYEAGGYTIYRVTSST